MMGRSFVIHKYYILSPILIIMIVLPTSLKRFNCKAAPYFGLNKILIFPLIHHELLSKFNSSEKNIIFVSSNEKY